MPPVGSKVRVAKDAESSAALRHKKEYDTNYESNPTRVKYRETLNQERRKRGMYGHGGPDISHTKQHTLVLENPHTNRARHFKEKGTLKSIDIAFNSLKGNMGGGIYQCDECGNNFFNVADIQRHMQMTGHQSSY
jgi:hypothetical protein